MGGGGTQKYCYIDKKSILSNIEYVATLTNRYPAFFNSFISSVTPNAVVDPNNYNVLQVPTSKLNYYISKRPFTLKTSKNHPVKSTYNMNFSSDMIYDILIYPDRIVYITDGNISDRVDYKVFKIPELTVLESGNDTKLNVYTKLKLNRHDIVGPNIYTPYLNVEIDEMPCEVLGGFRIIEGELYDIYMNSIRNKENAYLRYTTLKSGRYTVVVYY